jgi:hypothetical protein
MLGYVYHARQALLGLQPDTNPLLEAHPNESGRRQNHGIVISRIQLAEPRVDVAAQGLDPQVRAPLGELTGTAQAGGADRGSRRQVA